MSWFNKTIKGLTIWEDSQGQRLCEPDKQPDKCGWTRVTVNGRYMWESPSGERSF